jgi:hypothetical protein
MTWFPGLLLIRELDNVSDSVIIWGWPPPDIGFDD